MTRRKKKPAEEPGMSPSMKDQGLDSLRLISVQAPGPLDLAVVRKLFEDPETRLLMAEGYREQADFDRELAERNLVAAAEVLPPE